MVLRAHREMQAREAFADAVRSQNEADAELTEIQKRVAGFEAAMTAGRAERYSPAGVESTLTAYRQEVTIEARSEHAAALARTVVQQRRADFLAARRNVEVLTRLEQKARTAHRAACARDEQAALDDFAGRTARPSRDGLQS